MKKNLKVTGKVLFERHDFIKMVSEVLQATEDLQLERIIPVDKEGNPVELDSLICYVHQVKSEEIPDKFDPPKTLNMPTGITRPNRGVGKALKEIFSTEGVIIFDDIFQEVTDKFPQLTKKQLRRFLTRADMTGCVLEISGDEYWNPKGAPSL